jgi:hypothetical protein
MRQTARGCNTPRLNSCDSHSTGTDAYQDQTGGREKGSYFCFFCHADDLIWRSYNLALNSCDSHSTGTDAYQDQTGGREKGSYFCSFCHADDLIWRSYNLALNSCAKRSTGTDAYQDQTGEREQGRSLCSVTRTTGPGFVQEDTDSPFLHFSCLIFRAAVARTRDLSSTPT